MTARSLASPIAILILVASAMIPLSLAQNRGSYVGGINYPAGPATVPSNTYFLSGGISPVQILSDQYTPQPNSFLFSDHTKQGVVVAAKCEAGYMPTCPGASAVVVYMSNGDGTFGPAIISGGIPPSIRSIAVGDFNGDGYLDVAVAADSISSQDANQGSVSILLGDGTGKFSLRAQYPIGGYVSEAGTLAVGDFNRDGKLDLVVGLDCSNGCTNGSISVYPGNGDGTLGGPVSYPTVGNGAVLPVVGDFFGHGNGILDIVVGNYYAPTTPGTYNPPLTAQRSSLTILIGQGDGSFQQPPAPTPVNFAQLTGLVAADLNGDGKLDLAATTQGATLEILTGNGNGTFDSAVAYGSALNGLGTDTTSIAVADFKGTGEKDLVIGAYLLGHNGVQLFFNDGLANFTSGPTYGLGGWLFAPIVAQDFNGDGKVDVVMASACSENGNSGHNNCPEGTLSILLGNGDGTMQGARILNQNPSAIQSNSTITADVNGDGIPDLIQTSFYFSNRDHNQGGVIVSLGTGNGNYGPPSVFPTGLANPFWVAAGDFRGIGKIDLAVASGVGGVAILLGNGDGTFQLPSTYSSGGTTSLMLATGDFNGDGRLDVAVMDQSNIIGILLGNGDGTFKPVVVTNTSTGVDVNQAIAVADFNNDGKSDVALLAQSSAPDSAGLYDGIVEIFISNGDGTLSQKGTSYSSGGRGNYSSLAVGDVNRDGKVDIVAANPCQLFDSSCAWGSLGVLLGNGDGTFQSGPLQNVPDGTFYSLLLSDINGDGILDAIATNLTGVAVFAGNGDGSFQAPTVYAGVATGTEPMSLGLADLNIVQPGLSTGLTAILVNKAGTYLVTKSSANPSSGGQTVQLTTTVSPSYLTAVMPTGSISYLDGGTNLGSVPLVGGAASFNLIGLSQGVHTITAFYSGDLNFNSHYGTPTLQIVTAPLQSSQTIAFTLATSTVTFGISPITLSATASSGLPVAFSVISGPATTSGNTLTVTGAGSIVIEADQAGNNSYSPGPPVRQTLTVNQATPTITWPTPAAITYGIPLSAAQLNASANVPGVFAYSPAPTTVLGAGIQTLSVTFTPTDGTDYASASASVSLTVNKGTPTITWPTPATIIYGTPLSATQLNATANVPGTFAYSPAPTTVLGAGIQTLSVTFTPTDGTDYASASASVSLTVNKGTPTITWPTPATIIYGTPLSATQLNATANIPGTFAYSTAQGTVLNAGSQNLTATFTPTDGTDYTPASAGVVLLVSKASTSIVLGSSPNPSSAGQAVTLTATISPQLAGVPTGSVTFTDSVASALGSAAVGVGNISTLATSAFTASGSHLVAATYSGDLNFLGSSSQLTQTVRVPDFSLGAISPITVGVGGSGSSSVAVNPLQGFSSAVGLTVSGTPAGVSASLSAGSVTPPGSSMLTVNALPATTPSTFTLTVTGTFGTLTHSTTVSVTVTANTASVGNVIGQLLTASCVDSSGIGTALTSKLSTAQAYINAGDLQDAINTLTALINQLQAQSGKHIATSCTVSGVTFNSATALIKDVQSLINSLRVGTIADPITGYVVNSNGVGVSGATITIFDTHGNTVASATTDITGFYFLATTGVLTPSTNYTLGVTSLPAGFASSTPTSQAFTWQGTAAAFSNFVLN